MQTKSIKIQCPAKINLSLRVLNKREDGFHNIESVMQTISLYDYLDIKLDYYSENQIILDGNSQDIPYNDKNLVYKAARLFFENNNINGIKLNVYIDKSIPVSAGLAGGSTDGAGVLFGLNKLFNNIMSDAELDNLCAKLGSDLNFCLRGGCMLATSRGEILSPSEYKKLKVNLIKPLDLGISAKEAYTKFSQKLSRGADNRECYKNDLEWAVIDDYEQLQYIKKKYPHSMMTGSGSTYFSFTEHFEQENGFWVKNDCETIDFGIKEI